MYKCLQQQSWRQIQGGKKAEKKMSLAFKLQVEKDKQSESK